MSRKQSVARDIVDAFVAPGQFMGYDGAAYRKTRLGRIFAKVAKPYHLYALAVGACYAEAGGFISASMFTLGIVVPLAFIFDNLGRNKDSIIDTKGELPPTQNANKLLEVRAQLDIFTNMGSGFCMVGFIAVGQQALFSLMGEPGFFSTITLESGEKLNAVPMFAPLYFLAFSEYWKCRQIVDGNWRIIDDPPPLKTFSFKDTFKNAGEWIGGKQAGPQTTRTNGSPHLSL